MRYFIRVENHKLISFVANETKPKDERYREYATFEEYAATLRLHGVVVEQAVVPLTADEERDILLMDIEYRLIMLELGL